MVEIELKFQVPEEARARVAAEVLRLGGIRTRLQAAYFDLPGRDLARKRMALRVRQEGPHWVQTLKGLGTNAMERLEDNRPRQALDGQPPEVDPQCHAGSEVGQQLLQLLSAAHAGPLQQTYRTDIHRTHAVVQARRGRIEVALDVGRIIAGPRHLEVHELELELLEGRTWAVIGAARAWVRTYGLWLDVRSKAQMGERLARGLAEAEAALRPGARPRAQGAKEVPQRALQATVHQALAHASEIAGESGDAGHLRPLQQALQSLKAAKRLAPAASALCDVLRARELPALLRAPETTLLWLDLLAQSME